MQPFACVASFQSRARVWPHTVMHTRRYRCHSSWWTCEQAKCRAKRDRIRYRNPRSYSTRDHKFSAIQTLILKRSNLGKSYFDMYLRIHEETAIKIAKSLSIVRVLSIRANHLTMGSSIHNKEHTCNARINALISDDRLTCWITRLSHDRSGSKKF